MNSCGHDSTVRDDTVRDEVLLEFTVLRRVHFPMDVLTGIDVEHHVRVVVQAPDRSLQLRYVPAPHLVRPVGAQLGTHPGRMRRLRAPLPDRPRGASGTSWKHCPGRGPHPGTRPRPGPVTCPRTGHCSALPKSVPVPARSARWAAPRPPAKHAARAGVEPVPDKRSPALNPTTRTPISSWSTIPVQPTPNQ